MKNLRWRWVQLATILILAISVLSLSSAAQSKPAGQIEWDKTVRKIIGRENVIAGTDCGIGSRSVIPSGLGEISGDGRRRAHRDERIVGALDVEQSGELFPLSGQTQVTG